MYHGYYTYEDEHGRDPCDSILTKYSRGHRGRDRIVVGLTTTSAISVYYHLSCQLESRS
jgi:hypothetical protein